MRNALIDLFSKALQKMNPFDSVLSIFDGESIYIDDSVIHLRSFSEIYLLAMGKAAPEMARAVVEALEVPKSNTLVVSPHESDIPETLKVRVIEAEHPVPGKGSEQAGREALHLVETIPDDALLICSISGGTSSLLTVPAEGISLNELNQTHELLLHSGADIHQMNIVRKHLSAIKGGQLLRHCSPGITLLNLLISDVPGDDPTAIGSGPSVPDTSTFEDALQVLERFGLYDRVPNSVRTHLQQGVNGKRPETLKPNEVSLNEIHTHIVASAGMLAEQVAKLAKDEGLRMRDKGEKKEVKVEVAEEPFTGDVERVASDIANRARAILETEYVENPHLLVYYGESKVRVAGTGKGGRNQELALRGAVKIAGYANITWLSVGTDGVDGPTDAAGAVIDGSTIEAARKQGLDPVDYLSRNDSYHFHERMGTLVKTGPTGNNLMDLTLVVIW